jgi:ribose transport system permease protein
MSALRGALARPGAPLAIAVFLILALFAFGAIKIDGLASAYSINSMLVLASLLGIAATGQTIAVLLGGIDLSIPFVIGFADVVAAELTQHGWPFWQTVALLLAIALVIGATCGLISAGLKVHPLIVTLGVGYLVQGGVQTWTGGTPSGSAPGWMGNFVSPGATSGPLPLAPIVLLWAVVGVVIILLLRSTTFGRRLYAVGSNPRAARLALINPVRVWTLTFALSAGCAALAGILLLGFTGSAFAGVGDPYLFLSVGAVVIGGTSLIGGRGGYAGTMAGAIILTELTTILTGFNVSGAQEQLILGLVIVLVVLVYGRESHIRMRI